MANELRFSPAVPDELCWAIDFYESISTSLGNRVRDAFNRLFQIGRPITHTYTALDRSQLAVDYITTS